jgi:hypothetical protein
LAKGRELIKTINSVLGSFKTVYGIKKSATGTSWEFYFYDYDRIGRAISANTVLRKIAAIMPCLINIDDNLPYFMYSIEITPEMLREGMPLQSISIYIGSPGGAMFGGKSYTQRANGPLCLQNIYSFYDPKISLEDIRENIDNSAHLEGSSLISGQLTCNAYINCDTICVANKKLNDCIYYSGIDTRALIKFLAEFSFSSSLINLLETHDDSFLHLLYDIGIDYRIDNHKIVYPKTSFYGVF